MYYLLSTLVLFSIASYFDIKTREIPPLLSYFILFLGLLLHAVESFMSKDPDPLLFSAAIAFVCFAFAYVLYKIGVWAGGDVKLFTALGAILPQFRGTLFFPFLILAAAFIAILPFMIVYISYFMIKIKKLRKIVGLEFLLSFKKSFYTPFYILAAYEISVLTGLHWLFSIIFVTGLLMIKKFALPIVIIFSVIIAYNAPIFTAKYLVSLFIISIPFYMGIASFKVAKKYVLRETVVLNKLKEGMIPAQDLVIKNKKSVFVEPTFMSLFRPPKNLVIDSRKACGFTDEDIQKLKKLKIEKIVVKKSIPLVPVMTIGIVIAAVLQMFLYPI